MAKVLLLAEHDGKTLNTATARALRCAAELGDVALALFGGNTEAVADEAASLNGVSRVLRIDRPENGEPVAAVIAPQLAELAAGYDVLLAPSSTYGKDVLPRAAALLGVPQISDIMEIVDSRTFRRPIYAGNVITTVRVPESCKVVGTVRIASFAAVDRSHAPAPVESIALQASLPSHTTWIGLEASGGDRPDLQSATRVVAGGRGLGSKESFDMIFQLADKLGAAVGASRAAVDAGYVPNDMQVGQTGKIIAPDLYIAVGISGAIQHMTGIKDAGVIVAINRDGEAPIFEAADIGLVGDLFQILPELDRALEG
ncbi:MAG: electron transfer flavoprotein subunit beta [Gammaproteobacteria bacterium SG8_31]|jgi:electron transfer flavoprotein alpha subunit|nr:MAG: electron transfer flavoprotein subunit beta [Gammaproteobacteria bacterium SG8_31]